MNLPNEIIIELTNNCNLDCDFCFNKQGIYNSGEISQKDIFKVLQEVSDSGIKAVRFTGGEPFLRKDLQEILKRAKELDLYVILNTNALLINERNKNFFNYVDLVIVSLHQSLMFKKIEDRLRLLRGYSTKIMLATILTKTNIEDLRHYYHFISNFKNENFVEWFLLRPIPNQFNKRPISKEDVKLICRKMLYYNRKYNLDIKIANALPFCAIKGFASTLASICKGGHFDSGYSRLVVGCDGNYKADYFSDALGNIKNCCILDIWNSKQMKDIHEYRKVNKICKECCHLKKCKGGLIGREYLQIPSNIS